jgi:hypothetical protein
MLSDVVRSCDSFLYEELQGHAYGAPGAGRSELDKGTLAAAHIGLVRAGQRPPDRRTAYGPPPLVKPAALSARECRKPVVQARENGGTLTTRATTSAGNDGGRSAPGASARSRALPGGDPTGPASRRLAAVPASLGWWWARRYAPTGTGMARQAAVDSERPKLTTKADHNGTRIGPTRGDG